MSIFDNEAENLRKRLREIDVLRLQEQKIGELIKDLNTSEKELLYKVLHKELYTDDYDDD